MHVKDFFFLFLFFNVLIKEIFLFQQIKVMEYVNNAVVRSKIFTMSVQVPKQPELTEGIPAGAGG